MKIRLTKFVLAAIVFGAGVAIAGEVDISKLPPAAQKKGLTYANDIRPILETSCLRCHGQDRPKAGLRLDSQEGVLKGGKDGKVIVKGQSAKSLLVIAVARLDPETAMPPTGRPGRGGPGGRPPGPPPGAGGGTNFQQRPSGGPQGGPGPGGFGPPPKPLTPEQVGLIRAWIDQGAK